MSRKSSHRGGLHVLQINMSLFANANDLSGSGLRGSQAVKIAEKYHIFDFFNPLDHQKIDFRYRDALFMDTSHIE